MSFLKIQFSAGASESWSPMLSRVTLVGLPTVTDPLNDWSHTYSHTASWAFDTANPSYFNGDNSRAYRTSDTTSDIVYYEPGITSFEGRMYSTYTSDFNKVSFYVSIDDTYWIPLLNVSMSPAFSGGGGNEEYVDFTPDTPIALGMNYLEIEIQAGTSRNWNPEVSQVLPSYTGLTNILDPLNNWSDTASHSANWTLDTSNPSYYNGDNSRAVRTSNTTEDIIYHYNNISNVDARFYADSIADFSFISLYVSADMNTWTKLTGLPQPTAYAAGGGGNLYLEDFIAGFELPYSSVVPYASNYLKIVINQGTSKTSNPALSHIAISYSG
jgi:hypothetical protein